VCHARCNHNWAARPSTCQCGRKQSTCYPAVILCLSTATLSSLRVFLCYPAVLLCLCTATLSPFRSSDIVTVRADGKRKCELEYASFWSAIWWAVLQTNRVCTLNGGDAVPYWTEIQQLNPWSKILNISTEFFWTEISLIYSQQNADDCIISLSLVHNTSIHTFIFKHAQRFKGPSRTKFSARSTKTEVNVRMIKVKKLLVVQLLKKSGVCGRVDRTSPAVPDPLLH